MTHRTLSEPWWTALLTIWALLLIPVYTSYYGPQNFLWISDLSFFCTLLALWAGSHTLMGIAAVMATALELLWSVDFLYRLFIGAPLLHISDYMFQAQYPLALRLLSLFHLMTPLVWWQHLARYGYPRRALPWALASIIPLVVATRVLTDPACNINWVFTCPITLPAPIAPWWPYLVPVIMSGIVCLTHVVYTKTIAREP